jgi:hypothetical protein
MKPLPKLIALSNSLQDALRAFVAENGMASATTDLKYISFDADDMLAFASFVCHLDNSTHLADYPCVPPIAERG